ncbi:MAG: 1,4-dihydroxy-2-naphthoate polyprenyltransferase [Deltaproteobacteria bacterium]|nr:1,4-dihydroxy-2-naphthoate polyprenyltransferase [Deltaproteobacteria bacterium]
MTRPTRMSAFLQAVRPKTLGAAAAPVFVGGAMAVEVDRFVLLPFLAAFLGAMLLQIAANFANDYFDFKKGADTETRLGPPRATQQGWVTPKTMRRWVLFTFVILGPVAGYLVWVGGWPVIAIGFLSVAGAVFYTGGETPLGYRGLGDVMVLVFFGPIAVLGTAWVQGCAPTILGGVASLGPGFLSTAILIVNNQRDRHQDVLVGKKTLAVRFGSTFSEMEYLACHGLAFAVPVAMWLLGAPAFVLGTLLVAPFSLQLCRQFLRNDGIALNPLLGATARQLMLYSVVLAVTWSS